MQLVIIRYSTVIINPRLMIQYHVMFLEGVKAIIKSTVEEVAFI